MNLRTYEHTTVHRINLRTYEHTTVHRTNAMCRFPFSAVITISLWMYSKKVRINYENHCAYIFCIFIMYISYIVSDSNNRMVGSNLLQVRLHMYNWCEWTTWWKYSAAYRNTAMQNHHASPILLVPTKASKNSSIDVRMHSSLFLIPNWIQLKRQIYNHSSHKKWSKVTMQSLVSSFIFICKVSRSSM